MIVTAYRTGPALVSTGLLPECTILGSEECSVCGLPYIMVLTNRESRDQKPLGDLPAHFALLRRAIAQSHTDGHVCACLVSDGLTVAFR